MAAHNNEPIITFLFCETKQIFSIPYRLYDQVVRLMEASDGQVVDTEFMEEITDRKSVV